jgi:hypothetical protein
MPPGWVLVTYEQKTILPLLKDWGEQSVAHGGIIFVDDRTIAEQDVGGLNRALLDLIELLGDVDWENRGAFLRRAR